MDNLLKGAVDMHVHGYPDVGLRWKTRVDDVEMIRLGREYGLAGLVLKSHFWPTMDRVYHLRERLQLTDFALFSSITLNPIAGGLSPMSVEAAAGHGAKVVFLPTWGAANDHAKHGFVRRNILERDFPSFAGYLDTAAIRLLDGGRLDKRVVEIIAICKALDLVLCTAHISVAESEAVAVAAADAGFRKLVFSHPCSSAVRADVRQMEALADMGAIVEFTAVAPSRPSEAYEAIARIGASRCILSTDSYAPFDPPQPERFRNLVDRLNFLGCSVEDVRTMIVENPHRLLGME